MSEAKNTVPIYHKITLSIKEANELTGIGINRIEDHLREPNCPFVLFAAPRRWLSARNSKNISVKLYFSKFRKK